jgi:pilus assembly protein CpaF
MPPDSTQDNSAPPERRTSTGLLARMQSKPTGTSNAASTQPAEPSRPAVVPRQRLTPEERFAELRLRVQRRMLAEIKPAKGREDPVKLRADIEALFNAIITQEGIVMSRKERDEVLKAILADTMGYGPLEPLLADEDTTDIMVIGPERVYVERKGRIYRTNITFQDEEHLLRIIERIVSPLGRHVDEASPMVDARLPDGSRVNVIIPPVSLEGPALTIRKFSVIPLTIEDLINNGTATAEVFQFLEACVKSGFNILVSGGSSSGKTTLLNVLSGFIPSHERVVTIENAAELQLRQPHVVRLETRPPNVDGAGEVTVRDLVINSLRMRPDRIIVGEVRAAEAIDLIQAMNTGHDGSMGTIHANTPFDALSRLETMVLMGGMKMPVKAVREQMASALDLIVHMGRLPDGSRRILSICEVDGMEADKIRLSDIFLWEQIGLGEDGKVRGELMATGIEPRRLDRIKDAGIHLHPMLFVNRRATVEASTLPSRARQPASAQETATPAPPSPPPAEGSSAEQKNTVSG